MKPATFRLFGRLQDLAVVALILVLAGLCQRLPLVVDLTAKSSNTLSAASQKLLATMPEPITLSIYVKKGLPLRLQIAELLARYQRYKANFTWTFVDPDSVPDKTRELEIGPEGAVLAHYQNRTEKLTFVDEESLSNALLRLTHDGRRWVSFLSGHGERAPDGVANFAWGQFGKELALRDLNVQNLNLATAPGLPDNSALLVLADPGVALLPGEMDMLRRYLANGGNFWLLSEPDNPHVAPLLAQLGIKQQPGPLNSAGAQVYGISEPGFIVSGSYPSHPATRGLQLISVYPVAAGLEVVPGSGFTAQPLLESATPDGQSQVFGYALTRNLPQKQQRIIVVGDSDFLANTYVHNVGNLDLGLRMVRWLLEDDRYLDIPATTRADRTLLLNPPAVAAIGFGFLLGVPLALLVAGVVVWRVRRR